MLRHWPVASITLRREFFDGLEKDKSGHHRMLQARIEIQWEKPTQKVEPAVNTFTNAQSEKDWSWVWTRLVANPDGLNLYAVSSPPPNEGINPKLTDPRVVFSTAAGAPAGGDLSHLNRGWLRFRLVDEGLYWLDLQKLAEAGLTDAAIKPMAVRLYAHGEFVPLLRRVERGGQRVYFWNPANASEYTKEHVYWVTVAEDFGDLPMPPPDSTTMVGQTRELTQTLRTATIDRDNELLISYGDFRSVRAMRWADSKLAAGTPFKLPIKLEALAANSGEPIEATFNFYFLLTTLAHSPVLTNGATVKLETPDKKIKEITFRDDLDSQQKFSFDQNIVKDGMTTFTLTLERPLDAKGIQDLWFDALSVSYKSEARLTKGRLTLGADDQATSNSINWTPLPEFAAIPPVNGSPIGLLIGPEGKLKSQLLITKREDGIGAMWPNAPKTRAEIFDPAGVPSIDHFENSTLDDLSREDQGADYLIIAHHDFMEGIQPLADFHRGRGMRVRLVDIQSIYDQFSHGELTPYAIRDFLAYTLAHWKEGAPDYVLLVGDSDSDYRDYARKNIKNWVPTYARETGYDRWASDEWFGRVGGKDVLSEFMLGRISVNNAKDLRAIVKKYIGYSNNYPWGPWRAKTGLVADNEGEFASMLDEFHQRNVPEAYDPERVFLAHLPMEDNFYADDPSSPDPGRKRRETFKDEGRWMKVSTEATDHIHKLFRSGVGVLTYFGHGSPNIWADERIWFGGDSVNSDNLHLTGSGRMPLVINFTCNSGAIDYPIPQWNINITEDMLRTEDGGAVAAFVPSGPGASYIQEVLGNTIYKVIYEDGVRKLGEIQSLTKARYAATGQPDDYVYMYILLGDPAMDLQITNRRNLFTFELPRGIYSPGEKIKTSLTNLPFRSEAGHYVVQIANKEGDVLWANEPSTQTLDQIEINVPLEENLPPGPKDLRLYAWDSKQRRDFAASTDFKLLYPEAEITTATIKALDANQARIDLELENTGEIPIKEGRFEVIKVSQGRAEPVSSTPFELNAGEKRILKKLVPIGSTQEADGKEISPDNSYFEIRLPNFLPPLSAVKPAVSTAKLSFPGRQLPPPRGARLKLRPDRLRADPKSPGEGHTIFVHCEVENAGDQVSGAAFATLYDGNPDQGGKSAYDHNFVGQPNRINIEPLGAGRKKDLDFRWDPAFNAGDQTYWIQLDPGKTTALPAREDVLTSGSIHVRTAAKLNYRNKTIKATQEDLAGRRMFFHVEIVNSGESDAKNVSVAFYKSTKQIPENLIFQTSLDLVAGNSSVPVDYEWNFGSTENLKDPEGKRIQPTLEVKLKGSRLRISAE